MRHLSLAILIAATAAPAAAEPAKTPDTALFDALLARDAEFFSLFFEGCDPARLATMLTDDFEFYHDKGGVVATASAPFVADYAKSCAARQKPDAWRSRRELVAGSMTVHPIANYGAIEQGSHVFLERKGDAPEKLVGKARFTQLWKNDAGVWKLARVLSYDHEAVR